jgi:hypothetical protein
MKAVFNFIFSYVNIYSSLVCFENYNLLLVMGGLEGDVIHALAAISLVAISFVPLLCSFAVPFAFFGAGAYNVPSLASVLNPFLHVGVHPFAGFNPAPSNACSKSCIISEICSRPRLMRIRSGVTPPLIFSSSGIC